MGAIESFGSSTVKGRISGFGNDGGSVMVGEGFRSVGGDLQDLWLSFWRRLDLDVKEIWEG